METDVVICEGQEFDVGINQNTASDLECAKLCWDSDDCVATFLLETTLTLLSYQCQRHYQGNIMSPDIIRE